MSHVILKQASWVGGLIDYLYVLIDRHRSGLHFEENGYQFNLEVGNLLFKSVTSHRPKIKEISSANLCDFGSYLTIDCTFDSPITDSLNNEYDAKVKEWY